MKRIFVIGATGQIGSELTMELRQRYGGDNVVAGYIHGAEPQGVLRDSGPMALADVTDADALAQVVKEYYIDTIYNLAALLSVVAESKPLLAWHIGIDGLWNVLEVARVYGCAVFTPSSIGSFGPVSFIGLAVPHVARMLLGSSNHNGLLPFTMITGAVIALICNILSVLPGATGLIPLNAVTPVIGAPVIIYVIINQRRLQYFN